MFNFLSFFGKDVKNNTFLSHFLRRKIHRIFSENFLEGRLFGQKVHWGLFFRFQSVFFMKISQQKLRIHNNLASDGVISATNDRKVWGYGKTIAYIKYMAGITMI